MTRIGVSHRQRPPPNTAEARKLRKASVVKGISSLSQCQLKRPLLPSLTSHPEREEAENIVLGNPLSAVFRLWTELSL